MRTDKLSRFFKKLPSPEKKMAWFVILLVIKFVLLFLLVGQHRPSLMPDTFGICYGDCEGYITPFDNLIRNGTYTPDYRMPGYGFPYFIFRVLFDQGIAVNLTIISQALLDALAALLLGITLFKITGKKASFYMTMLLYGVGITVSCYNNWILTESFTSSALVIGFYFFVRYFRKKKKMHLFWSGLFFTWAYFLRPVNAAIIPLLLLFVLAGSKRHKLKYCLIFLLPAIICNSAWTFRNYKEKEKVFALTEYPYDILFFHETGFAAVEFCKAFSDFKITLCYFETAGLTYFGQAGPPIKLEDIKIPDEIYTEDFNEDSLLMLRRYFDEKKTPGISQERYHELEGLIVSKMTKYRESMEKHHPFLVYVKTPLMLTAKFVAQSGVHNLYHYPLSYLGTFQKVLKIFFILIYWIAFVFFLLGIIFFYKQILHNKMILSGYLIAFYIIFIHSIVLRSIEPRYLITAYPFFVVGAAYTLSLMNDVLFSKKRN